MGKSNQAGGNVLMVLLAQLWSYTGALASVAVFAGVLGLGLLHVFGKMGEGAHILCYSGACNPAGNVAPYGLGFLGRNLLPRHPHVQVLADKECRTQSVRRVDENGAVVPFPGSQVAEQRVEYDAQGRVLRRRNLGADGSPAADAHGVSQRVFEYDAAGRLIHEAFLGADGKPVLPKFPGYAHRRLSYDGKGRLLVVRHLDVAEKPVVNAAGESRIEYIYDDDELHYTTRRNMVNEIPTDNADGFALEITETLPDKRGARCVRFNAAGMPVAFHPAADAVCEHLVRLNENGYLEWECYAAANGLPAVHPDTGYAERVCAYSPEGRLLREWFWNAQGREAARSERCHIHTLPDAHHCLSLFTDGHTEVTSELP